MKERVFLLESLGRFNGLADTLARVEDAVIQHVGDNTVPNLKEQAYEEGRKPLTKPGLALLDHRSYFLVGVQAEDDVRPKKDL